MKKRTAILLEILIGLSLTAILLTFLFSFLAENAKLEKKLEQAREEILRRGALQTRLTSIFSSTSTLYTKKFPDETSPSLILHFDNGIDPEPAFSGSLLGRIYIDKEKNLSFACWPQAEEKNQPWRNEILFPKTEKFHIEFLSGKTEESLFSWKTAWPKTETKIPSIIRLFIHDLKFAFLLPSSEPFVTYETSS